MRTAICVLAAALLAGGLPFRSEAKSYSSGGGHSYSSHSSSSGGSHSFSSGASHSSGSGGSHSFSSGSGHSFSSGSSSAGSTHSSSSVGSVGQSHRTSVSEGSGSGSSGGNHFSSGSGKSYSAGSTWSDNGRHSYSSSKSYSSGAGHTFAAASGDDSGVRETQSTRSTSPDSSGSRFAFDNAAAQARREEVSKSKFTQFKESQLPPQTGPGETPRTPSYRVQPPPIRVSTGTGYQRVVYVPDAVTLSSRPVRIYNVFNNYSSRPWVTYQDPYNSLFWWWLLDRSIDDRAWWAYHHRYDMDPARYQALVASDQQLESRVEQLEAQQAPRDPSYTPPGVDRDLMYSDNYVQQTYSNRPTTSGAIAFWVLAVPTALGVTGFFIWLIWFKRWQTTTPVPA